MIIYGYHDLGPKLRYVKNLFLENLLSHLFTFVKHLFPRAEVIRKEEKIPATCFKRVILKRNSTLSVIVL